MANTLLTVDQITREALRVLHEKLSFIGTINRDYDSSFAKSGAKIGDTLRVRLPNQYTVRTGATLSAQDTTERKVDLAVTTQKGVDMNFTSAELTMDLDDFSKRIIEPAMAVLASNVESDALTGMTPDVYNLVGTAGTTPNSLLTYLQARQKLNQGLAPKDDNRCLQIDSEASATIVNALTGLFHDSNQIAKQYREGMMGRSAGFDWYENERAYVHSNGADVAGAINDAGATIASGDTTIPVDGFTAALAVGSVFTIANVYAVHPETKQAYSHLQQFTVTSATTTAITLSPAIYSTGALQNVDSLPADNAAITAVGSASTDYNHNLAYHKDAFAFATADLVKPDGVDFCSRQVYDGISMRVIRDYDINNDKFPCRLDILYGYQTIRPELACRITS